MRIYSNQRGVLKRVHEVKFKLEKDIQNIIEKNLSELFDLTFVRSEFCIRDKRIDSLAFNEETNSFTIIEYKRDKNYSVMDQGYVYLGLMLEYRAEFILEYNERLKKNLKRDDVDWTQSRIIFISPSFTDFQIQASNFKDAPFELWEVQQYENGCISLSQYLKNQSTQSIKPFIQNSKELKVIAEEIVVYTEDRHKENANEELGELYEKFKNAILNLDDGIEVKAQKLYIAFKKEGNLACVEIQKKQMKIHIGARAGTLDDPKNIAKDVSKIGHVGTGDYEVIVNNDENLEYIMSLIKQAIK